MGRKDRAITWASIAGVVVPMIWPHPPLWLTLPIFFLSICGLLYEGIHYLKERYGFSKGQILIAAIILLFIGSGVIVARKYTKVLPESIARRELPESELVAELKVGLGDFLMPSTSLTVDNTGMANLTQIRLRPRAFSVEKLTDINPTVILGQFRTDSSSRPIDNYWIEIGDMGPDDVAKNIDLKDRLSDLWLGCKNIGNPNLCFLAIDVDYRRKSSGQPFKKIITADLEFINGVAVISAHKRVSDPDFYERLAKINPMRE